MPARVLLVGFEDQDNLGLRYLAAYCRKRGHLTRIVPFGDDPGPLLAAVREFSPHVVGFSLIFEYMRNRFARAMAVLRAQGVTAHFTMGGHYPSFRPAEALAEVPFLDSVVLFEGEETLAELASAVAREATWRQVPGLAFRLDETVAYSPRRTSHLPLDEIPWPDRQDLQPCTTLLPGVSMLGSRGCTWRCTFCSIAPFYRDNGTPGRRLRNPGDVVDEIEHLHRSRGAQVILWQDDDFLAGGAQGVRWAHAVADGCVRRGLHRRLRWKISCRSNEATERNLAPLARAGLTHVYLGVESGNLAELEALGKHLTPDSHRAAASVLRELGLSFSFGFMLFTPWTTLETLEENLRFLREFTEDGSAVITFSRTLPYAGTALAEQLAGAGRLVGRGGHPDYEFLDPAVDVLYRWCRSAFFFRNHDPNGTVNVLNNLLFYAHLSLPERPLDEPFLRQVQLLTAVSNDVLLASIEALVRHARAREQLSLADPFLASLCRLHDEQDALLRNDIEVVVSGKACAPAPKPLGATASGPRSA